MRKMRKEYIKISNKKQVEDSINWKDERNREKNQRNDIKWNERKEEKL